MTGSLPTSSVDEEVLGAALAWLDDGQQVYLVTVVNSLGSSPRPPGAIMAVCGDGRFVGSVSGGCIEKELAERLNRERPRLPVALDIGITAEDLPRFGLACGGSLRLIAEPVQARDSLAAAQQGLRRRQVVQRRLDLQSGAATCQVGGKEEICHADDALLVRTFGPCWRVVIIGANQLSGYCASMAAMLGYEVRVCESRAEYLRSWQGPTACLLTAPPDEALPELGLDARTAVLALSHQEDLDDLALLEALGSPAFYVGALGSQRSSAKRQARLARYFGLAPTQLERLHSPVGLPLGGRTAPEIALSIMADVTAHRYQASVQRQPPQVQSGR